MEDLVGLGQIIRTRRLFLKLRMEDVSRKVDISRATLGAIEKGKSNCSFKTFLNLLDCLGLSLNLSSIDDKSEHTRKRAPRQNTKLEKDINRFIITCIEQYANKYNLSSAAAYKRMFDGDIIDTLHDDYDDLHGMSFEYLVEFINKSIGGDV